MTSRLQQAKNEKLLKDLARLPENKRCAICSCMGTQYTCQPPSIYICETCAGVVRNFPGHRVKSCTMATYSTDEVTKMKNGGNKIFAETYLSKWNQAAFPPPIDKNVKKVENFIRQVLIEKNFYTEPNSTASAVTVHNKVSESSPQAQTPKGFTNDIAPSNTKPNESQSSIDLNWEAFPGQSMQAPRSLSFNSSKSNGARSTAQWASFSTNPVAHKAETVSHFSMRRDEPILPPSVASVYEMPLTTPPTDGHSPVVMSTNSDGPFARSIQNKSWDPFSVNDSIENSNTYSISASKQLPTGWSTFENNTNDACSQHSVSGAGPKPQLTGGSLEAGSMGKDSSLDLDINNTASPRPPKQKSTIMQPLPENLFTMPEFNSANIGYQQYAQGGSMVSSVYNRSVGYGGGGMETFSNQQARNMNAFSQSTIYPQQQQMTQPNYYMPVGTPAPVPAYGYQQFQQYPVPAASYQKQQQPYGYGTQMPLAAYGSGAVMQGNWMMEQGQTNMDSMYARQGSITFSPTKNEETANPAIFRHLVDDLRSTLPRGRSLVKTVSRNGGNMFQGTGTLASDPFQTSATNYTHQIPPAEFSSASGNPFA